VPAGMWECTSDVDLFTALVLN